MAATAALALAFQTEAEMHRLERLIGRWSVETFGPGERLEGHVEHLRREYRELGEHIERLEALAFDDREATATELADVVILAFGLGYRLQLNVTEAVKAKMLTNLRRRWRPADASGCIEHDRSGEESEGEGEGGPLRSGRAPRSQEAG
jgi:NTP pyrophosphatase (non-canonical NTP hydrolase)